MKPSVGCQLFAAVLAATSIAVPALAQVPPQAKQLYDEAVNDISKGDYASACPKLKKVTEILPDKSNVSLDLAECYSLWGKLASAWRQYKEAETVAKKTARKTDADEAADKLAKLTSRLATLTIEVPEALREAPSLTITLDDATVDVEDWGAARPVDKGTYTLTAAATGYEPQSVQVKVVSDGSQIIVSAPLLSPVVPPKPPPTVVPNGAPSVPPPPPPRSKLPGFVLGGVGVAALIAGGALLGIAAGQGSDIRNKLPKKSDGSSACYRSPTGGEDPACADLRATAQSASVMGNAGIGVLIAGGLFAGAGVIYLLLPNPEASGSKKSSKVVPVVSHEGGGLLWTGSF
jgi:hypothetical protein